MKTSALLLTLIVLLMVSFTLIAFADEANDAVVTPAAQSTPAALAPFVLDPTQGALSTAYMGCADENLVLELFYQQPEQTCIDYCTNNGWAYLSYDDVGRGLYICFCCSA